MAVAQDSKPVKKASAPKKSKSAPSHPPYIDMIKAALVSLKERTGSSTYAIAKHIEEQQKVGDLPPNFRKLLAIQIKKFVASGKLVKVKNSFKLPSSTTTTATAKKSPAPSGTSLKPKPKAKEAAPKKKTTSSKPKAAGVKKVKSPVKKAAAKKVGVVKAKKPKSIKSPVKKAPAAKKAKK